MNSWTTNFRKSLVTLATAGMLVPSTVLAGGGGGGHPHGPHNPSIQTSLNSPLHISGSTSSNATISSSSGKAVAPTIHNNANNPVLGSGTSTTSKQTKIVASASNLNGSVTPAGGLTVVHSKNVMDLPYNPANPLGSVASDPLGSLNQAITSELNGPNTTTATENDKANSLTNGSQGQYGDGASMGTYPAAGTSKNPAKPAAKKDFGAISNQSTLNTTVHEHTSNVQTLSNVSSSDLGKNNVLNRNDFATVKNATGSDIGKNAKGAAGSSAPQPNPPAPPKPMHKPYPFPSGSVFGDGSDDGTASSGSTDDTNATTPATETPVAASGVDLVLEDVKLAAPATLVAGPAYTVKFRNQGTLAAGKFKVAIFAGLSDKPTADAPRAMVEVKSLAAGEVKEVTLRLSAKAMRMVAAKNAQPSAFTHLFVAVDLTNTVAETDETNNTAAVERLSLEAAVAK